MTYTEADIVETIKRLTGTDPSALTHAQLDGIDQFHTGGPDAVDRLIPSLRLVDGMMALDVGSGLGGPARQVARLTGCRVLGVDVTQAYVAAARELTATAGESDQVQFLHTDVAELDQTGFDAAFTIHVQMNVKDKQAFYSDIARHLRPGARLAIFEVCRSGDTEPTLPLPWSIDGSDSYLATADELRDAVQAAGFDLVDWVDESDWAKEWFAALGRRIAGGAAPAALPALLADGPTRMLNFAAAVLTGTATIQLGSFVLAAERTR
ncbi:MAG TPA: class I SAM-dependent methyltransferase [Mycobacteriales bacterium]|jgi:SAM-dependent methyltransferase|nr:class I SAM-dependent methyltransferase [Mycobacteriales bacterium]